MMALCDGPRSALLATSEDHKAVGDGDVGPNTGGMGTYSPSALVDDALRDHIVETIFLPTVRALGCHPLVNVAMVKKGGDPIRIDVASTLKKDSAGNPEGTITVGRLSDSYRMLNYLQKAAQLYSKKTPQKKSG